MHVMLEALARTWWLLLLLRGVAAIALGVLTLLWPGVTLVVLVLFCGAYALADGVLALLAAVRGGSAAPRAWLVIAGVAGIAVGVLTAVWPGMTAVALVWLIGAWALANGVLQIVAANRLRTEIEEAWLLVAGGVVAVLLGLVLLARPNAGALAIALVVAVFAIVYGVLLASFACTVRWRAGASRRALTWPAWRG